MPEVKNIETGVDRLITIIQDSKSIDLDKAANELGVSEVVVREWAEFLEEEKMISIDYGLSKITLSERRISKKEAEAKVRDYHSKKEAFVRNVETTIKSLDKETADFNYIKEEFQGLKKHIGSEMEDIKVELDELKHYEDLKHNIDNDIQKQKQEYSDMIEEAKTEIRFEERRYSELLDNIGKEKEELTIDKKELLQLEEKEDHLRKRLEAIYGIVKNIEGQLQAKENRIEDAESHMNKLQSMANDIEGNIRRKRKDVIDPLIQRSEEQAEKISIVQNAILEKISNKEMKIEDFSEKTKKLADKFSKFFDKKMKIEHLLTKIDDEKHIMDIKLRELIRKVQTFDILSKDANTKVYMQQLHKTYNQINNKRNILKKSIQQLAKLIRGG